MSIFIKLFILSILIILKLVVIVLKVVIMNVIKLLISSTKKIIKKFVFYKFNIDIFHLYYSVKIFHQCDAVFLMCKILNYNFQQTLFIKIPTRSADERRLHENTQNTEDSPPSGFSRLDTKTNSLTHEQLVEIFLRIENKPTRKMRFENLKIFSWNP